MDSRKPKPNTSLKSTSRDQAWIIAKKKYRLSAETVQMAKELGLNPKKLGSKANHKRQKWKSPLDIFIRALHEKRFNGKGKTLEHKKAANVDQEQTMSLLREALKSELNAGVQKARNKVETGFQELEEEVDKINKTGGANKTEQEDLYNQNSKVNKKYQANITHNKTDMPNTQEMVRNIDRDDMLGVDSFVEMLEYVSFSTRLIIEVLENAEHYTISNVELSEITQTMHILKESFDEMEKNLIIFQSTQNTITDLVFIESVVKCCKEIKDLTKECQILAEKVSFKTAEIKGIGLDHIDTWLESKYAKNSNVNIKVDSTVDSKTDRNLKSNEENRSSTYGKPKVNNFYHITDNHVQLYKDIRESLKKLHISFFKFMDREAFDVCGAKLEIAEGNSLRLNAEHELNIFVDYCLYQYRVNGLNVIERSFQDYKKHYAANQNLHPHLNINANNAQATNGNIHKKSDVGHQAKTEDMLGLFEIASKARFAYLDVVEPVGEDGAIVFDRVSNRQRLMLDKGLNRLARQDHNYTLVSHIMDFEDFIITTGAFIPVSIHTQEGIKVERRFRYFLSQQANDPRIGKEYENYKLSEEYKEYVTDIYKICLHENIIGNVQLRQVPFGAEALKARVGGSNTIH